MRKERSKNPIQIQWSLDGLINGVEVHHTGQGIADPGVGVVTLQISLSGLPQGWHPLTVPVICSSRLNDFFANEELGAKNLFTISGGNARTCQEYARSAVVRDDAGNIVASAVANTIVSYTNGLIRSQNEIRGTFELPSNMESIPYFDFILWKESDNRVGGRSHYQFRLTDGRLFYGVTTVCYECTPLTEIPLLQYGVATVQAQWSLPTSFSHSITSRLSTAPIAA